MKKQGFLAAYFSSIVDFVSWWSDLAMRGVGFWLYKSRNHGCSWMHFHLKISSGKDLIHALARYKIERTNKKLCVSSRRHSIFRYLWAFCLIFVQIIGESLQYFSIVERIVSIQNWSYFGWRAYEISFSDWDTFF